MINELLYWLGQIGLGLSAVFGAGIVIIRGNSSGKRYFFAVWATAGLSAVVLCLPATQSMDAPWQVSLLRLAVGGAFTEGYFVVRKNLSYGVTPTQLLRANKFILIGISVAVVVLLVVAFFRHANAEEESDRRKDEIVQTAQKIAQKAQQITADAIAADTSKMSGLRLSLDSTNKLLRANEGRRMAAAAAAARERESLGRRTKTIEKNTDTLKTKLDEIVPEKPTKGAKKNIFQRIFGGGAPAHLPDSLGAVASHGGLR